MLVILKSLLLTLQPASQRKFFFSFPPLSVWWVATVQTSAVSAGPSLTQWVRRKTLTEPESTAEWHPAWDRHTEWQTAGNRVRQERSKVNRLYIALIHLLHRLLAKQVLKAMDQRDKHPSFFIFCFQGARLCCNCL